MPQKSSQQHPCHHTQPAVDMVVVSPLKIRAGMVHAELHSSNDSNNTLRNTSSSRPSWDETSKRSSSFTLITPDLTDSKTPLSTTRLFLAHIGAALTLFLATTDATIVSTILPTIAASFDATANQYTWTSVTYMLTQTAFQPLYGKVSDLVGRMTVLYTSIFIFALGSALCAAAQSMLWLMLARALAGIGGGGIVSLVWTITSEIVEVHNRAKWSQALSVTWACSAIAGPILGGAFSSSAGALSWRWAFILNIPACAAATVVLWLSLRHVNLGSGEEVSWIQLWRTFDFLGLCLFMGGSSCLVIGFNIATVLGWEAPATIGSITGGLVALICAGLYDVRTTRDALFPPVVFTDLTIVIVLVVIFLHNFAFNSGTFYLALWFQSVDGLTPLRAGLRMLPYSLGSSLASMPSAWFIGYWQRRHSDTSGQKIVMCVGLAISTLGFGLMMRLTWSTISVLQSIYPLIAGVGIGMLFHAPYQIFLKALENKDTASGTSAFFLVRFTGATVGLTVAGAIFNCRLVDNVPPGISASDVLDSLRTYQLSDLRYEVTHAISLSIRSIWFVCCPCLGVALLISPFTRNLMNEAHQNPKSESVREKEVQV